MKNKLDVLIVGGFTNTDKINMNKREKAVSVLIKLLEFVYQTKSQSINCNYNFKSINGFSYSENEKSDYIFSGLVNKIFLSVEDLKMKKNDVSLKDSFDVVIMENVPVFSFEQKKGSINIYFDMLKRGGYLLIFNDSMFNEFMETDNVYTTYKNKYNNKIYHKNYHKLINPYLNVVSLGDKKLEGILYEKL